MISFKEFICEEFLFEMPHISLPNGKIVDLELEVHSKMTKQEFIQYITDWINGKVFQSKYNTSMQVPISALSDFVEKLLANTSFFKPFVVKNYGVDTWDFVNKLLLSKL